MGAKRHFIDIVTAADGSFTGYGPKTSGRVESIHYIKDLGANPLAATADLTFTVESTGEALAVFTDINANGHARPRAPTIAQTGGAALLYAAGGTPQSDKIAIAGDRVKLVVAQGGNAKIGRAVIIMAD